MISRQYQLDEFFVLGNAVQQGNLTVYNQIMNDNQSIFIKHGIYLVLEQTKSILYRNLCRRIYLLYDRTIKFPLQFLEIAINCQLEAYSQLRGQSAEEYRIENDSAMDTNEVECIVSNLIYSNRIKGYILHEKRLLVLSNKDPFPSKEITKKYLPSK